MIFKYLLYLPTVLLLIIPTIAKPATFTPPPTIKNTLITVGWDGSPANGPSFSPTISDNGKYVVFSSGASNLVPNDTNETMDVFLFDLETEQMELISVASDGTQGNDISGEMQAQIDVSNDGRYVAFPSNASNLVPNDTNEIYDVFIRDRQENKTRRISENATGKEGNEGSYDPSISADGQYIAFSSSAGNLTTTDIYSSNVDIFIYDKNAQTVNLVSTDTDGVPLYSQSFISDISGDGHFVSFFTDAANFAGNEDHKYRTVAIKDLVTGELQCVTLANDGVCLRQGAIWSSISHDGQKVAFTGSTPDGADGGTLVYNRNTNTSTLVAVTEDNIRANSNTDIVSISGDGQWVVFPTNATNLLGDSGASLEYYGPRNVFLHNIETRENILISPSINGGYGNGEAYEVSISFDGGRVAFASDASDLVLNDINGYRDIFVYGWKETPVYHFYLPLVLRSSP